MPTSLPLHPRQTGSLIFLVAALDIGPLLLFWFAWGSAAAGQIGLRINGYGLPGLRSAWFRSRRGGRVFVDIAAGGAYLLISRRDKPPVALGLIEIEPALRLIEAKTGARQ